MTVRVLTSGVPGLRPGLLRGLVPAGLLFGAVLASAGTARSEPLSATYEVYFGGFHVLDAVAVWDRIPGGYRIAGEAETQGMIGWLHPWKGVTESQGRIAAGKVIPQSHQNRGTSEAGERIVALNYNPQGDIAEALVQPERDWEEHHPLPSDAGVGTLDPLSVIAGMSELLESDGTCEGSFPVFDGRRRYDVFISDAGAAKLEATDYSVFAGEARACRLDYQLLGGHRIERNKYAATARERIIWIAQPQEGAPLIPVRLQIETAYGTVMGHLTGFAQGAQAQAKLADALADP